MKHYKPLVWIYCCLIFVAAGARAQDLKYLEYDADLIPGQVYKERREKLMQQIGNEAVAIFYTNPERNRNADLDFPYAPNSDFYYLTGFREPNAILVLAPKGTNVRSLEDSTTTVTVRELLFVQQRNLVAEKWNGRRYGPAGAMKLRGFEYATTNDKFKTMLPSLLWSASAKALYAPTFRSDLTGEIMELLQHLKSMVEQWSGYVEIRDPITLVRKMRVVKSPEEIALLAKATEISAAAHRQAMMSVEPGMGEYELEAVYEYVFRKLGAEQNGYPCIVASGENSVILHYNTNRRKIKDGDVVLADCAAEYRGYSSDITRTYPANGKFSKAQREIYQLVLDAQKTAIAAIKPGVAWLEVSKKADEVLTEGLFKLGVIKEKSTPAMKKFYYHGLGHPVGLNVHDVGQPIMEAGMVYTVEPGIYIAEGIAGVDPAYYNIGVRIEDVILVTADGNKNLSAAAPREIAEVEALMKQKGVGNLAIQ
ncbi:aminopeptidase P N-terminal domain-containing protein [candidate division KSB1 bacterium]|nr:aminopeptidase P N-terminal domain-containing protein [candidate division KSB1 bacterium]